MSDRARERRLRNASSAALSEQARAERYRQKQWLARRGRAGADDRGRALEFDESGYPVARSNSSLVRRVARLLKPL